MLYAIQYHQIPEGCCRWVMESIRDKLESQPASTWAVGPGGPGTRDPVAEQTLSTLRIMACGDNGSMSWMLYSIRCAYRSRQPVCVCVSVCAFGGSGGET